MKKYWIFLVLGLSIFAFNTFGFTLTAMDAGGGRLQIGYQLGAGEGMPIGFGLRISLDQGAYISSPGDVTSSPYFPVFMDYAFSNVYYEVGQGHPVAANYQAGVPYFPVSSFSICMAAPLSLEEGVGLGGDINGDGRIDSMDMSMMAADWLAASDGIYLAGDINGDAVVDLCDYAIMTQPAWSGSLENLLTIQLHDGGAGMTNVIIAADSLRGGIVGNNLGAVIMPQSLMVVIPEPCTLLLLGLGGLVIRKR